MKEKLSKVLNYIAFVAIVLLPICYIIDVWIDSNENLLKLITSDWILIVSCFIIYAIICYKPNTGK